MQLGHALSPTLSASPTWMKARNRKSSRPLRPTSTALRGLGVLQPGQSLVLPSRARHLSDQDVGGSSWSSVLAEAEPALSPGFLWPPGAGAVADDILF